MPKESEVFDNDIGLVNLPPSLLELLFKSYLFGYEISAVEQTCHSLRDVCRQEVVWKERCKQEYDVQSLEGWNTKSFREAYTTFLYKHGWLIGVWKFDFYPYGGLMNIQNICRKGEQEWKDKDLSSEKSKKILFTCCHPDKHEFQPEGQMFMHGFFFGGAFELETRRKSAVSDLIKNGLNLHRFNSLVYSCSRKLSFSSGIFKGTYSAHGVELINVIATDEWITGFKLTGDPNIPATKITFKIDLSKPCYFPTGNLNDNDVCDQVKEDLSLKPFCLSSNYHCEISDLPDSYMNWQYLKLAAEEVPELEQYIVKDVCRLDSSA